MKVAEYIHGEHSVHDIKYHIVWITKYRYKILTGKVAQRVRELLIQGCRARGNIAPSKIAQYLKGRSSKLLQDEFRDLGKRYWGQHLWARGYFCATVGSVTKDMIQEYIEKQFENGDKNHFKVES